MRIVVAIVLLAVTPAFTAAAFDNFLAKRSTRQTHHRSLPLVDTCAYLDSNLLAKSGLAGLPLTTFNNLNVCLCLSTLPTYIQSDTQLQSATKLLGDDAVTSALTALIKSAPGSRHCSYPQNSKPVCTSSNPCNYKCKSPYVARNGKCVCAKPNSLCKGVCSSHPNGCNSGSPHHGATPKPTPGPICKEGESWCGVYGTELDYVCIDIDTCTESCGGCVVLPANDFNSRQPLPTRRKGRNCSLIENVVDVSCSGGSCQVHKCKGGYKIGKGGDICVKVIVPESGPSTSKGGHGHHSGETRPGGTNTGHVVGGGGPIIVGGTVPDSAGHGKESSGGGPGHFVGGGPGPVVVKGPGPGHTGGGGDSGGSESTGAGPGPGHVGGGSGSCSCASNGNSDTVASIGAKLEADADPLAHANLNSKLLSSDSDFDLNLVAKVIADTNAIGKSGLNSHSSGVSTGALSVSGTNVGEVTTGLYSDAGIDLGENDLVDNTNILAHALLGGGLDV